VKQKGKMFRLSTAFVQGKQDGFSGLIDGPRVPRDESYAEGVIAGVLMYHAFLQSTRDHGSDFRIPSDGLWSLEFDDSHPDSPELVCAGVALCSIEGKLASRHGFRLADGVSLTTTLVTRF
jgi:hypothetical protein